MHEHMAEPRLWEGMLGIYAAPGVADACVEAQDVCEVDVLLLLAAAVLAQQGLQLTASMAARLSQNTRAWHSEVVVPLRILRRRWRGNPAAAALRERVKVLELDAERVEVDCMQAVLDAGPAPPRAKADADLLESNLAALGPPTPESGACALAMRELNDRLFRTLAAGNPGL